MTECLNCESSDIIFYPGEDDEPDIYSCLECGADFSS